MRRRISDGLTSLTLSTFFGLALVACSGGDDSAGETAAGSESASEASGPTASGTDSGASASGTTGATSEGTTGWGSTGTGGTTGTSDGSASASAGDTDTGQGTTDATTGDATTGTSTDTDTTDTDTTTTGGDLCDDQSPVTLFLSPDDSNSMSSPVQVRASVLDDFANISAIPLRVWEFFNYYTFAYPPAPAGQVAVTTELFRLEDAPVGEYLLQIGVTSETVTDAERAPMNITLVLDESGSMTGKPMDLLKESCRAIAASLKVGDIVSMVGWDTKNAIKLAGYQVTGPNDAMLLAKIEALAPGGGTDLNGGLKAGYQLASASYDPARINRVVLISDGGANAGVTDIDLIAMNAGSNDMDGIYMVGVGVGQGQTYNDVLMDTVTDVGKGASVFIPDEAEAWKIFNTDFVNTMAVAARDVQVKLDMPPGFEIVKFSGEEFSENPEEIEPQHLAPNDTMVFHQTIATCAPDAVTDASEITVTVRYKDALSFEQKEVIQTITFGELLGIESPLVRKGAALYAYTEVLKAVQSFGDVQVKKDEFAARAADALTLLPDDDDIAEMKTIVDAL